LIAAEPLGEIEGLVLRDCFLHPVSIPHLVVRINDARRPCARAWRDEAKINELVGCSIASRNGAEVI